MSDSSLIAPPAVFEREQLRDLCTPLYGCTYAEGFWDLTAVDESEPAAPVESSVEWVAKDAFLRALCNFQRCAKTVSEIKVDAIQRCKLCSTGLQMGAFRAKSGRKTFVWPKEYAHYIAHHNVLPSCEFYQCVERHALGEASCTLM